MKRLASFLQAVTQKIVGFVRELTVFLNKPLFVISFLLFIYLPLCANDVAGGHTGNITALIHKGDKVISAAEDGYIVIWDTAKKAASQRFQLTFNQIQSAVSHPQKDEICIVETGSFGSNIISVWDYSLKKKLFSLYSSESVRFINYSANGSFIIAAGLDGRSLTILSSQTGEIIKTPDIPSWQVSFAITGRAERNMFIYQSEYENYTLSEQPSIISDDRGQILYIELDSGSIITRFNVPGFLSNPVIFKNNNFLAGISSNGLLLVDAASGAVFDIMEEINRNALLYTFNNELYCLNSRILYRFSVNNEGKFVTLQKTSLKFEGEISSFTFNGSFVFASLENIMLLESQNNIIQMAHNSQMHITEIAAGNNNIAVLTEENDFFIIPLDYNKLENEENLQYSEKTGYTKITNFSFPQNDQFILWQSTTARNTPVLVKSKDILNFEPLNFLTGRFPIRSISTMNNKIAVLDSAGNLSIRDMENISERANFSFSFAGAVDAAFINSEYLFLSRSAVNNNSPFIFVNHKTGETVHIAYPAQSALSVYTENSGNIYAEVIQQDENAISSAIVRLTSVLAGGEPVKIFQSRTEALYLSVAESEGRLAISANNGAFLFLNEIIEFERTEGLPVKLLGCDNFFISLDNDGNIAWNDNKDGKLLAVFSLYKDQWRLSTNDKQISGVISEAN